MRKFISALATSSVLFSMMASSVSGLSPQVSYSDVSTSHENYMAVEYLTSNDIVEGYKDGTYRPGNKINRAEFIKIASLMLDGADKEVETCISDNQKDAGSVFFSDVPADLWYAKYVCLAKNKGLIKGYDDGTFRPDRDISFAEASKIVLMVFDIKETEDGDQWYTNYVKKMEELKSIPTDLETPHTPINRGHMAEIIWRIAEKKTDRPTQTLKELEAPGAPSDKTPEVATEAFPAIASCEVLSEKISAAAKRNEVFYMEDAVMPTASPAPTSGAMTKEAVSESSVDASAGAGSGDFSQTNIQVEGVDEADIIKNDGQYIYVVRKDTVRIVKAYPVENMVELSKISFKDDGFNPSEIYVYGDTLVVVGTTWYQPPTIVEARELMPYERGHNRTKVYVVDVKDRKDPKKLREVSIQGNYASSRRVGDYAYLVLNKYPDYYYGDPIPVDGEEMIPRISDSAVGVAGELGVDEPMVGCTDIHYFPGYVEPNYLVVAGIPLADNSQKVEREVILGASENIYSSAKNLYVASTDYNWGVTPLPEVVDSANPDTGTTTEEILPEEKEKTIVYKFGLDKGKVAYQTTGAVPGRILNQFSMDENGDYFRIATTKGEVWDTKELSSNNLYVLDKDMKIVGKIENIAPGERIYSTRFIGKRGYMVTFKKVDPLFVFDLSDPTNPKILGKLKIPGFSDYLHPYDENHIIGFGKDTVEATEAETTGRTQFAWYQGMKMAIFDITNVEEPKELFVKVIGDRGTDSELLHNHKALLFDKEKKLLAFPVTVAELTAEQKQSGSGSEYGTVVFQGAHVYDIDLVKGFELRGTVTHYDNTDVFDKAGDYFYGDYGLQIKRMIYIGENLYSISEDMIKGLTMDTVQEKNRIQLKD